MRLARKKSLPSLPSSLAELASLFDEGHLRRYSCCDEIMFKGCVHDVDGQATMIFACTTLLQLILSSNIEEIHVDATFKVVPSNMGNQLLTIHSMIDNYSIPIVYCLMESKTRNSYNCVFNFLKTHLLPNFNPSIIITDYESALRDTLISIFPTARTTGCWFHHNQAVWRNMRKKGFLMLTNTNEFASKALKMLFALPLLPAGDIQRGFDMVRMFAVNHGVPMGSLFDYYQNYWLRQVGSDIVSVNGLPRRTNNCVESFHNTLRNKFNVVHPNLWIFLDHLCHLSMSFHNIVAQLNNNLRPTRNYRVTHKNLNRILHASQQYSLGLISMWQFLQRMSHVTTTYEQQQRNWVLHVDNEQLLLVVQPVAAAAAPVPVAAAAAPVPVAAAAPVPVAAAAAPVPVAAAAPVPVAAAAAPVPVAAAPVPVAAAPVPVAAAPVPVAAAAAPVPVAAAAAPVPIAAAAAAPVPIATLSALGSVAGVQFVPSQVILPPIQLRHPVLGSTQRPPVELPENGRLVERDHPYHIQENGRHRQRRHRVEGGRRHEFNAAQAWEQFFEEIDHNNSIDMEQGFTTHEQQPHREEEILEVCIICYNEISTVSVIPCQHHFCRGCIERWMQEGATCCPLCRTNIIRLQN
ncbi:uncharacterized protein LOC114132992 isoform X2 [Aphis gossypii]|nr:uncharacterized protein LOC114132992 isoform X2 [Aphis gossypii]